MAILDDLIALVYTHTNRPDLTVETKAMVKKAALKLHGMDFWKQDLKEVIITPVPLTAGSPRYQLDLSDSGVYPLFRKVDYIKDYSATATEKSYDEYAANDRIDGYGMERTNYWYQMGLAANLVASSLVGQIAVGYYAYPNITDVGFSSWIATQFPDAIAEEAARAVFKMIGKDEEHLKYQALTQENEAIIRMAGI